MRKVKDTINRVKQQYAANIQLSNLPLENILNKDISFDINDRLFYETLLLEIRGETISFASYKKSLKLINSYSSLKKLRN